MDSTRTKHASLRRKPNLHQNPELTTAQLTLGKTAPVKPIINDQQTLNYKEVLQQAEQLWIVNDILESINLMKGLLEYLRGAKFTEQQVLAQVHTNLAVSYYKIGFLEESYDEFAAALSIIKDATLSMKNGPSKGSQLMARQALKLKYDMLTARIQLQVCILFSEMGKHQLALDHAKIACKITYNLIYDLLIILYQNLIALVNKSRNNYANAYAPDRQLSCQGQQDLVNNIAILEQLIQATKDFKQQYISKQKSQLLDEERYSIAKIGKLPTKIDLQLLYALTPQNVESLWIFKNKILDQIQMKFVKGDVFETKAILENNQLIQKMVYLAISLYCYSTQTRFLQKNQDNIDPSEVLDSEHCLSRSLEIAYTFLPQQAPILNQILTVHDRFHGIDKQTIPEDKEVGGFFKVLRPLSKPKSTYSNKNIMCSPIMIRIQMPKLDLQINEIEEETSHQFRSATKAVKLHQNKIQLANKTIDLDSLTKNNKIRGLNGPKKYDFAEVSQSTIRQKNNTKTDFTDHLKNIYATRKIKSVAEHTKNDRMKINLTGISSSGLDSGVKSMRRPHSYDKQINKPEQHFQIQTERKKKSVSLYKKDHGRRRSNTTNSTTLKLDGLQVMPKKNMDEDDGFQFSGRISNLEATKIGGNIFINNNINLFISKDSKEGSGPKQLSTRNPGDRTVYEIGRRQSYMSKRKAHNSIISGPKVPDFPA